MLRIEESAGTSKVIRSKNRGREAYIINAGRVGHHECHLALPGLQALHYFTMILIPRQADFDSNPIRERVRNISEYWPAG
jgi:hypothetical protein